jgi:hypothetical protein
MNAIKIFGFAAFVVVPAFAISAIAAPTVPAAQESCANIRWNAAFLTDYPKAPAACREVVVKDGVKYAKFNGKVSKVGHHFVQVAILDVADIPISSIAFEIGAGGEITVGDTVESVKDLKLGDKLSFWVPEGQFGVSPTLTAKPMKIIKPESMPAN